MYLASMYKPGKMRTNVWWFPFSMDNPNDTTGTFVLRFYGPVNTIKVMLSRSVNLSFSDYFPKRLTGTKCPYFRQSTLESAKLFHDQISTKDIWPDRGVNPQTPEYQ